MTKTGNATATDREDGSVQWRDYDFSSPRPVVRRMTRHGWSSTVTVGDYNDWQIRDGVLTAAELLGILVPDVLWYVEPERLSPA